MIVGVGVIVRWRTRRPPQLDGYDLWDGAGWVPITWVEYQSYKRRGLSIHVNPRWSGRG